MSVFTRIRNSASLYNVMTIGNKEKLINIRVKDTLRDEFRVASELRGGTMSTLLHQFIVKTVREEKERSPDEFQKLLKEITSQPKKSDNGFAAKQVKEKQSTKRTEVRSVKHIKTSAPNPQASKRTKS